MQRIRDWHQQYRLRRACQGIRENIAFFGVSLDLTDDDMLAAAPVIAESVRQTSISAQEAIDVFRAVGVVLQRLQSGNDA